MFVFLNYFLRRIIFTIVIFSKQFSGRKLTWLHHLSNGDVKLGYTSKTYIINMTTTQVKKYFLLFIIFIKCHISTLYIISRSHYHIFTKFYLNGFISVNVMLNSPSPPLIFQLSPPFTS